MSPLLFVDLVRLFTNPMLMDTIIGLTTNLFNTIVESISIYLPKIRPIRSKYLETN